MNSVWFGKSHTFTKQYIFPLLQIIIYIVGSIHANFNNCQCFHSFISFSPQLIVVARCSQQSPGRKVANCKLYSLLRRNLVLFSSYGYPKIKRSVNVENHSTFTSLHSCFSWISHCSHGEWFLCLITFLWHRTRKHTDKARIFLYSPIAEIQYQHVYKSSFGSFHLFERNIKRF